MDKICKYRHRVSQNLVEQYLLDNIEDEYEKYRMRCARIEEKKKKMKKTQSPEKLQRELERLNFLFQKERIDWDYYNKEYDRIENELKELSPVQPMEQRDYSHLENILNTNFKVMYGNLAPENRRAFWRSTIKEIFLNDDSTIKYVDFL